MELLSSRLGVVLSMFAPCECLADIGSDHGYLITTAVQAGRARRGIAVEINQLPFEQTQRTVEQQGLATAVDVRLGDGLKPLQRDEADAVCIAGMGGGTIKGILSNGRDRLESVAQLVLQPNVDAGELRAYLLQNGLVIVDEQLVADGGFIYQIIKAQPGSELQEYNRLELEYGRLNFKRHSDLLKQIIARDLKHWEGILLELTKARTEHVAVKRQQIELWMQDLKTGIW
ncbi:MAG: tRNA (adenine22-N1)-methyltransferase [Bacillota bacterium]|nr:MAG: tRNA (adenine22-N1)-methyltransferase [Bacillota bacterium]